MKHVGLPTPKVFITADDVKAGKPAPDGYLLAASRLNLKPTDCVVIEDAPAGIQAGKSAGMRVIAVASTLTRQALSQADVAIHHLSEINLLSTSQGIQIRVEQLTKIPQIQTLRDDLLILLSTIEYLSCTCLFLKHPAVHFPLPVHQLFGLEPESDFLLTILNRV